MVFYGRQSKKLLLTDFWPVVYVRHTVFFRVFISWTVCKLNYFAAANSKSPFSLDKLQNVKFILFEI